MTNEKNYLTGTPEWAGLFHFGLQTPSSAQRFPEAPRNSRL